MSIAKQNLISGNIDAALSQFSTMTLDNYRTLFKSLPPTELSANIGAIGSLTPISISDRQAQYYFTMTLNGQQFVFTMAFIQERADGKSVTSN
jgi:hypothetical protein